MRGVLSEAGPDPRCTTESAIPCLLYLLSFASPCTGQEPLVLTCPTLRHRGIAIASHPEMDVLICWKFLAIFAGEFDDVSAIWEIQEIVASFLGEDFLYYKTRCFFFGITAPHTTVKFIEKSNGTPTPLHLAPEPKHWKSSFHVYRY